MKILHALATFSLVASLAGCTAIPADPDHTLDRVRTQKVLRAGASPASGFVEIDGDKVTGREADLVTAFAQREGARVEWHIEGEEHLMTSLEDGALDLVIGGLTSDTPWEKKAALTRPYAEDTTPQGRTRKHVIAAPLGENAFISELERFLDEEGSRG